MARADSPYNSFKDVIKATSSGTVLRYGSMVPEEKIPMMKYAKENNLKLMPVPTKGGAAIMTAILGGHVDFGYSGGLHYAYVKAGKMKVLASAGAERLVDFPDVPTLMEQGVALDGTTRLLALVPAATPADIQKKIEAAFRKAAETQEYKDLLEKKLHFKWEYVDAAGAQKAMKAKEAYFREMLEVK